MSDERGEAYAKPDVYQHALAAVTSSCRRFRDQPTKKYQEEVARELASRLRIPEIDKMLPTFAQRFEKFPTMLVLEAEIKAVERARMQATNASGTARRDVNKPWESSKAPGTPITAETMFHMIRNGKTNEGAFEQVRNTSWAHLTDDEVWAAYNSWTDGKVHPCLQKPKEEPKKPLTAEDLFG